jgi:hypothetical protein
MSSCPWATGNHAIAACARGRPWAVDGCRLRKRTATGFPGSFGSNPNRFGASRNRIHRRKRRRGRPSASKAAASQAKIASPRFLLPERSSGSALPRFSRHVGDRADRDPLARGVGEYGGEVDDARGAVDCRRLDGRDLVAAEGLAHDIKTAEKRRVPKGLFRGHSALGSAWRLAILDAGPVYDRTDSRCPRPSRIVSIGARGPRGAFLTKGKAR